MTIETLKIILLWIACIALIKWAWRAHDIKKQKELELKEYEILLAKLETTHETLEALMNNKRDVGVDEHRITYDKSKQ